jgi:two-component system nitrate/nitrite response regulator NarL
MSHHSVFKEEILPLSQEPLQQILTLLFCENHFIHAGITHILSGSRFNVSGERFESTSRLPEFPASAPALFIFAITNNTTNPVGLVADLRERYPSARIVALSDDLELTLFLDAWRAGLSGICSMQMSRDALVAALELVMLGETFIPAALALQIASTPLQTPLAQSSVSTASAHALDGSDPVSRLSEREAEVLMCLMEGASNKSIARKYSLSEATVKVHIKAILRKIQVANRTQAAIWASKHLH